MADDNRGTRSQDITIAAGQTESSSIDCRGMSLTGLLIPVALTGTSLTFKGSIDGTNFFPVKDSSNASISCTVSGANFHVLNPLNFLGLTFVKVVSGSAEAAARTITAVLGDYTSE